MHSDLVDKISKIKLVIMDVDGVLTDGGLYYTNGGDKFKKFYVKDGTGIRLLIKAGLEVAFITGLESNIVSNRAYDLGVRTVIQNCFEKDLAAEEIIGEMNLSWEEVAFIGDDLIDLALLRKVGFAVSVCDAVDEIKEIADYITSLPGGRGAVRELCDLILQCRPGHSKEFWN
jgi:3-deoxy-D-manno-octulosonate 8-phosphate phosphatase (KDO 8-P phosphatase)